MTQVAMTIKDQILVFLQETPGIKLTAVQVNDCLDRAPTKSASDVVNNALLDLFREGLICREKGAKMPDSRGGTPYIYWVDGPVVLPLPLHQREPWDVTSAEELAEIRGMYQVLSFTSAEPRAKWTIIAALNGTLSLDVDAVRIIIDRLLQVGLLTKAVKKSIPHVAISDAGEKFLDRWFPHCGPVRSPK